MIEENRKDFEQLAQDDLCHRYFHKSLDPFIPCLSQIAHGYKLCEYYFDIILNSCNMPVFPAHFNLKYYYK